MKEKRKVFFLAIHIHFHTHTQRDTYIHMYIYKSTLLYYLPNNTVKATNNNDSNTMEKRKKGE